MTVGLGRGASLLPWAVLWWWEAPPRLGSLLPCLLFRMRCKQHCGGFSSLQVVLGGGQEAMDVTTTSTRIGKFEARLVLFSGRAEPALGVLCCAQSISFSAVFGELLNCRVSLLILSPSCLPTSPRFFHLAFEEEFGRVKGHFGPINSVAFHPDGKR